MPGSRAWVVLGVPGVLGLQWAGILAGPIFPAWVFPSWFAWRQSWFTSQDISFDWFWANTVSWENETFPILGSSDLERMSWQKLSFGMGDWGSFGYSWFFSRQCLVVLDTVKQCDRIWNSFIQGLPVAITSLWSFLSWQQENANLDFSRKASKIFAFIKQKGVRQPWANLSVTSHWSRLGVRRAGE